MPMFSIISCSRNAGPYARRSIESVIAQTDKDWELWFVDDASTDDTAEQAVPSIVVAGSRAVFIHRKERRWKLQNFLEFVSRSTGTILVELDGDDHFASPNVLSRLRRIYETMPTVDATCGSCKTDFEGGLIGHPRPHIPPPRIFGIAFAVDYPAPRTWRRSLLDRALTEVPGSMIDPDTGTYYRTSADYALFAPVIAWARYIHPIDEVLVNVTRSNADHHDFREYEVEQIEACRKIRAFWQDYTRRTQGDAHYA